MQSPLELPPTFADRLAGPRPLTGMWVSSGSATAAEILAASGLDWLLIDGEHSPYDLGTVTDLLRAVAPYPATPVVRVPVGDTTVIKRYLDLGAQNLMVPMVDSAADAEAVVRATRYPPEGVRGVGSALARSARWNLVPGYLARAARTVSVTVQVESAAAVDAAAYIASVEGVDAVFVGPSDLAASMGHLGDQSHPDVVAAVTRALDAVRGTGTPVGVNAFDLTLARRYVDAGASFVLVGADVQQLAASAVTLAGTFRGGDPGTATTGTTDPTKG